MRKLVQEIGDEDSQPDESEGLQPIEIGGIPLNLVPIQKGEANGKEDEACGAQEEGGGKAEPELGQLWCHHHSQGPIEKGERPLGPQWPLVRG